MSVSNDSSIDIMYFLLEDLFMFSLLRCKEPGCTAYTFSGGDYCYHHSPDKEKIKEGIIEKLRNAESFADVSIAAADFRNLTLRKGIKLSGVNFSFCVFDGCVFEDTVLLSVFFDFCLFTRCAFKGIDGRYTVFSGSTFANSSINDSMVIHSNFMGIEAENCDFSGNDFYYSNFSLSRLISTSLDDCNLKRTSFRAAITKGVTFRYSNPEDAYFRKED